MRNLAGDFFGAKKNADSGRNAFLRRSNLFILGSVLSFGESWRRER